MSDERCRDAVLTMSESYRQHMRKYSQMRALEVWYSHVDAEVFVDEAKTAAARKRWQKLEKESRLQTAEHIFPKIADKINGQMRIVDHPPLVYHPRASELMRKHVTQMFHQYRKTLPADRRLVLDRYHIIDV